MRGTNLVQLWRPLVVLVLLLACAAIIATGQGPVTRPPVTERGQRWSVVSQPAVSTQATASKAAVSGLRHVADCVSFSAGSTTAPVLTQLTVNLRDGATGAGTVIWTHVVIIPAATGQNVAPFSLCGLGGLVGTNNTAMTLEFSALLANLFEAVSLSGYDVLQ